MKQTLHVLTLWLMFLSVSVQAFAENLYFSQAGGGDGTSCGSTLSVAAFNTAGNWGGGAGKISAGDTVLLCVGTFTSRLTMQGSGTVGNPITISPSGGAAVFDAQTTEQAPFYINGQSYLTFDGLVGNAYAGDTTYNLKCINVPSPGNCIYGNDSPAGTNIIVRRLEASGSATSDGTIESACIRLTTNGNMYEVSYNWCHGTVEQPPASRWTMSCVMIFNVESGVGFTNVDVHHNLCENLGIDGLTVSNNVSVHDNLIRRVYTSGLHSDSINVQNGNYVMVYNNAISESSQQCIYVEQTGIGVTKGNYWIFNNVVDCPLSSAAINLDPSDGDINTVNIFNNVLNGSAAYVIRGNGRGGARTVTNLCIKNNILYNSTGGVLPIELSADNTFQSNTCLDNNIYVGFTSGDPIVRWTDAVTKTLGQLRALSPARETNGAVTISIGLDGTFHPTGGSPSVNAGADLSSLGINALNSDKNGSARPAGGAWEVGAYELNESASHRFSHRQYFRKIALDEAVLPVRVPDYLHLIDW